MNAVIVLVALGATFGLILGLADKFLRVEVDSRIEGINALLPQFNCGACGSPGCMGLAERIVEETAKISDCKPLKKDDIQKIYDFIEEVSGPNGEKIDLKKVK